MARRTSQVFPALHSYHYEDDAFYARFAQRDYSYSLQVGEFILDMNNAGELVGFELLSAANVLHLPKEALRHLLSMNVRIDIQGKNVRIDIRTKGVLRNGQQSGSFIVEREAPEGLVASSLQMALA